MFLRFRYLLRHTIHDIALPEEVTLSKKSLVILRTHEGTEEIAEVVACFTRNDLLMLDATFTFLREATESDREKFERQRGEKAEFLRIFGEKIITFHLNMHPVDVEQSFDGAGLHFMFTAEERVDFRELVKDLAAVFKKKIYLQQIGPRDRSRLVSGFGVCGRELCCSTFLHETPAVSMDAVRTQNIFFKDRDKLTGLCGKLKCCLNYELDEYARLRRELPGIGSLVQIKSRKGSRSNDRGKIIGLTILDQLVRVVIPDTGEILTVPVSDVHVLEKREIREEEALQKEADFSIRS
jgi:cell fate regulator YaaT (PSP1 superfamily)